MKKKFLHIVDTYVMWIVGILSLPAVFGVFYYQFQEYLFIGTATETAKLPLCLFILAGGIILGYVIIHYYESVCRKSPESHKVQITDFVSSTRSYLLSFLLCIFLMAVVEQEWIIYVGGFAAMLSGAALFFYKLAERREKKKQ